MVGHNSEEFANFLEVEGPAWFFGRNVEGGEVLERIDFNEASLHAPDAEALDGFAVALDGLVGSAVVLQRL